MNAVIVCGEFAGMNVARLKRSGWWRTPVIGNRTVVVSSEMCVC